MSRTEAQGLSPIAFAAAFAHAGNMTVEAKKKLASVQKKLLTLRDERERLNGQIKELVAQENDLKKEIKYGLTDDIWGICKFRTDNSKKLIFIKKILFHVPMTDALFSECSPALKEALLHLNPLNSIPFALFNGLDGVEGRTKKECARLIGRSSCVDQIMNAVASLRRRQELHLLNGEFLRVTKDPFFIKVFWRWYPELEFPKDLLAETILKEDRSSPHVY